MAALLALVPATSSAADVTLTRTEQAFLAQINEVRSGHGLTRVSPNDDLTRAARFHSNEMVEQRYFDHGVFWRRLVRFGVTTGAMGEALGWDSHIGIAVPELVEMWLQSPEHRAVVLSTRYREVGIGVAFGPFEGFPRAVVVTADFRGPADLMEGGT